MEKIQEIFVDQIKDPQDPMRSELNRDSLFELAENIKANGLINPITVRPVAGGYEVVAGHRRLSACKIAGKIKIQCVIRDLDDAKTFEVMAAENLERQDVDPVDEAVFIGQYKEKTGKSDEEIAKSLKRSVAYVKTRLLVGTMPDYMQDYLRERKIPIGVATTLMEITDEQTRRVWTELAARDGASVAQAEYWLYDWKRQQLPGGVRTDLPPGDFVAGVQAPVMFECAIDGQRYDVRTFKTVMIYEGNMGIFNEFVSAFREPPSENESGMGG